MVPQVAFRFNFGVQTNVNDYAVVLDISLPIGNGVTAYYGRYSFVFSQRLAFDVFFNGTVDLGASYPAPFIGQRVQFRARVVLVDAGAEVGRYYQDWVVSPVESWSVSPADGSAPATMTVTWYGGGVGVPAGYDLTVFAVTSVGSCPLLSAINLVSPSPTAALQTSNTYVSSGSISVGSCQGLRLRVRRLLDNQVVYNQAVYRDNL